MTEDFARWPLRDLEIADIRARGHRPVPFQQFIIKIHSRCNLSCSYCYVYEMAEQENWRALPKRMADAIAAKTVMRIAEHARRHNLPSIDVILHGGEPLLAGIQWIGNFAGLLREAIPDTLTVNVSLQTNGTRLNQATLAALKQTGVRVGVSLDGDAEATGRYRRYAGGRNSYHDVADGLSRLNSPEFRSIYGGILCTIDVSNDPIATYEALLRFNPPAIDLLLPHANLSCPPPGSDYASWLIQVFERWYSTPVQETRIRLFTELIQLVLGMPSGVEGLGLLPSTLIVVDTDGSIKQLDSLSSAYDGAANMGLHVLTSSFDAALDHPTTVARQIGIDALSEQCRACSLVQICGGGLYPHRYREKEGFLNPSVYCHDLTRLITHVRDRVRRDLARLSTARSPRSGGSLEPLPGLRGVPQSASAHSGLAPR